MKNSTLGFWHETASIIRVLVLLGAVFLLPALAAAHFTLNLNTRIFHVEHLNNGLRVYLRLPMPYLVANLVSTDQETEIAKPPPYTTSAHEDGAVVYYLNVDAVHDDPEGLGALVVDGHQFVSNGVQLQAIVESVRVYPTSIQPPFSTLSEARASFQGLLFPRDYPASYVGDTVVDVVLLFANQGAAASYLLSSSLDPGLPEQDMMANMILDYYPGGVEIFQARGLLHDPIAISRSPYVAALTFVKEGMRHILGGLDHVLFVVCLALGAIGFKSLLSRITGFTIGHSLTLSLGFFGFVPHGAWFIPAIELGIALSIIYAALIAVRQRSARAPPERTMFVVTTAIGALHGLGFSFLLFRILQVDSPNIWQSLLSFNIGVEVGQFLIILICWPVFRLLAQRQERSWRIVRWSVAIPCIAIATYWAFQRAILLMQSV